MINCLFEDGVYMYLCVQIQEFVRVCKCSIGCDSSVSVEKELIGEFDLTFGFI